MQNKWCSLRHLANFCSQQRRGLPSAAGMGGKLNTVHLPQITQIWLFSYTFCDSQQSLFLLLAWPLCTTGVMSQLAFKVTGSWKVARVVFLSFIFCVGGCDGVLTYLIINNIIATVAMTCNLKIAAKMFVNVWWIRGRPQLLLLGEHNDCPHTGTS